MKKMIGVFAVLCMAFAMSVATTGCTKPPKKSPTPADPPADKDIKIVSASPDKVTLKPGEDKEVEITISRGKDAKGEVTLSADADKADAKLTLTPGAKLAKDGLKGTVKIAAHKESPKGKYTVTVKAKEENAKDVKIEIPVEVVEVTVDPPKKDYALTVADVKETVTIKQGATGKANVNVTLGKDLAKATIKYAVKNDKDKDVDAKDVTVKGAGEATKTGDVAIEIVVGDAAAPGDYTVWAVGTGDMAKESKGKVNVKVEKK